MEELQEQSADLLGLLLLHPVPRAFNKVASHHVRTGAGLHLLEGTGHLVVAPVTCAGDEARGTSMVRPENNVSSEMYRAPVAQRYHWRPPWKPVRSYSVL